MLFNLILYLVIPWIFGVILYNKDRRLFLSMFPFSCMVAFIISIIGTRMGYWSIYPFGDSYFSSLTLSIGLYPILGTYLAYFANTRRINPVIMIVLFSVLSTVIKWVLLIMGRTIYANGWNIIDTFILFTISYTIGYAFYTLLKKRQVLV